MDYALGSDNGTGGSPMEWDGRMEPLLSQSITGYLNDSVREVESMGYSVVHWSPSLGEMITVLTTSCFFLGLCSLFINLFVIVALVRNRRRVLKNVFYVIVLNCCILDVLRGLCLIISTAVTISVALPFEMDNQTRFKIIAYCKWILRQCNLMTILNLLVFTSNEFVVIRYPLHYRRYCRRRVILGILVACWVVSITFGVCILLSSGTLEANAGIIVPVILCYLCLIVVLVCYGFILRTIRRFHRQEEKVGEEKMHREDGEEEQLETPLQGQFTSMESHKINNRATVKSCAGCERGQSKRCNSHRKWRSHLMSRHKYLIVIGTVLLVDVLFLIPYSGIQILSFLLLNNYMNFNTYTMVAIHLMNILIGLHSVCQPLCYFRMTEFRRLACCHGRAPWNKGKSFSNHKSFANTRSQLRDEDADGLNMTFDSPRARQARVQPLIEHARLVVASINPQWSTHAVRFRAYAHQLARLEDTKTLDVKESMTRSKSESNLLAPYPTPKTSVHECP